MQVLYQVDLSRGDVDEALRLHFASEPAEPDVVEFSGVLVRGVVEQQERIDGMIADASINWKVSRMSYVDRNVLRIAVFEFTMRDDIPASVSMNEAIELGKRFGTTESGKFINGILDKVARTLGLTKGRTR